LIPNQTVSTFPQQFFVYANNLHPLAVEQPSAGFNRLFVIAAATVLIIGRLKCNNAAGIEEQGVNSPSPVKSQLFRPMLSVGKMRGKH